MAFLKTVFRGERNIEWFPHMPPTVTGPTPRLVFSLGVKLVTFWFAGQGPMAFLKSAESSESLELPWQNVRSHQPLWSCSPLTHRDKSAISIVVPTRSSTGLVFSLPIPDYALLFAGMTKQYKVYTQYTQPLPTTFLMPHFGSKNKVKK